MALEIKLDVFEGPLDLLLHLIYRNEVSITDIPIALITEQYLETVELMKSLNLDVAGEYLVMAAYLTHVKSQMLLPSGEGAESEEEVEDPRDELVAHLLEYKRYKEAAHGLAAFPLLDREVFVREDAWDQTDAARSAQPLDVGLPALIAAFRDLVRRTARRDLLEIEPDRLSVKDKISEIMERLREREWITFGSLFDLDASRANLLTTLLALLEVVRLQVVRVYQDRPFGTILISRRVADGTGPRGTAQEMRSESDLNLQ
jgi:segregation and condensation protein A